MLKLDIGKTRGFWFETNAGPPTLKDKKPKLNWRVVGSEALEIPRLERRACTSFSEQTTASETPMHGFPSGTTHYTVLPRCTEPSTFSSCDAQTAEPSRIKGLQKPERHILQDIKEVFCHQDTSQGRSFSTTVSQGLPTKTRLWSFLWTLARQLIGII